MVYVVERYLPGFVQSELLQSLQQLQAANKGKGEGARVRYLGSTIVPGD